MTDKLTWQMAADYLEEKGFDEQATALRVMADGPSAYETARALIHRCYMCTHVYAGPKQHYEILEELDRRCGTQFTSEPPPIMPAVQLYGATLLLDDHMDGIRVASRDSQAEYDIIQRDEARMRQIPNGGV